MRQLRDHYLRIDPRSLGLFRIAMALVLIGDLVRRFRWVTALYSNSGVLPNHHHLFTLKDTGKVWSLLHAFTTPGEVSAAFVVFLVVYLGLLVGWKTRAMHLASLVALVSLTGRNILLENAGNYIAIALVAFTAFLPTGSRYSIDALRSSLGDRDEKTAADLNDRGWPTDAPEAGLYGRGFSPVSIAALGVILQIVTLYLCSALTKTGPWRDGSALHYALHDVLRVSRVGVIVQNAMGLTKALTFLVLAAEWAIPLLVLLPVARWRARTAAIGLVALHALTLGLLFDFGLYAWTLLAAAPLLVTTEMWDRATLRGKQKSPRLTVVYDADCGLCLFVARVLKRLDGYERLTFQGNDALTSSEQAGEGAAAELLRRDATDSLVHAPFPAEVSAELVERTVVVVSEEGRVFTRGAAVSTIVGGLPFGTIPALVMRLPGAAPLLDALYDFVAGRRLGIGEQLGFGACGVPVASEDSTTVAPEASPATRLAFRITASLREALALLVLAAMLVQTTRENRVPGGFQLPQGRLLGAIAHWPRMMARWDVLSPRPATETGLFVVDGQTKAGKAIDPLTGKAPTLDVNAVKGTHTGQLWADYLDRIHRKEWQGFQSVFRDYLVRGGANQEPLPEDVIVGFDAYWISSPIAPAEGSGAREKIFTHSRGGRTPALDALPLVRPDVPIRPLPR